MVCDLVCEDAGGRGVQSYEKHADIILKFSLIVHGHLVMQKGLYIDKIDDEKFKFVPCVKFFMNSIQNLKRFLISNCSYSLNI